MVRRELSEQVRGKGVCGGQGCGLRGEGFLKNARIVTPGYAFPRIPSIRRVQHEPEGIVIVPLVKGRVDGRLLSAVNVGLK